MAFDGTIRLDTGIDESGITKALGKIGSVVATGVTASVAALGTLAAAGVKVGSDFEAAMSQVAATMGTTTDKIPELTEAAKHYGETTQFSATQAAEALNYMALAGYDSTTSIAALPTVLNLAAAGGMDLALASDMVTDSMSALGLTTDELEGFVDQMSATSQNANTNIEQLGSAILTVGGTAKTLSGGVTEMNVVLGLLADNGIKGAEGGTALRNVILSLSAPTDKARQALKELGVETVDASGDLRAIQDVMEDLGGALDGLGTAERAEVLNTIFNKVDLKSVNALLGTTTERWEELTDVVINSSGSAAAQAETLIDNLQGDVTILKSALEGLGIAFYEGINSPLRDIVQTATESIGTLTQALSENGLTGLVEAVGGLISDWVVKIAEAAPMVVESAVSLLQSFISGIVDNIGLITESALEIVMCVVTGILETLPSIVEAALEIIVTLAEGITAALPTLIPAIVDTVLLIVDVLLENLPLLLTAAIAIIEALAVGLLGALPDLIAKLPEIVVAIVDALISAAPQLLRAAAAIIVALGEALVKSIPKLLFAIPQITSGIVNALISAAPELLSAAVEFVNSFGEGLKNGLTEIAQSLSEKASEVFTDFVEQAKEDGENLKTFFTETVPDLVSNLGNMLREGWETITSYLSEAIPRIIDNIKEWWDKLPENLGNALGEAIGAVYNWGTSLADYITTTVPKIIETIVNFFKELPGKMWTWLLEAIAKVKEWGETTLKNASEKAAETIAAVVKFFSELPGKLWEWLLQAINNVKKWCKDLIETAQTEIPQFIKTVVDFFLELPGKIFDVGVQMVKGLWEGIQSMVGWIGERISGFVDGIKAGFTRATAFDINSPSRWAREVVGRQLPLGIVEGIDDTTPAMQAALQHAIDNAKAIELVRVARASSYGSQAYAGAVNGTVVTNTTTTTSAGDKIIFEPGAIVVESDTINNTLDAEKVGRRIADKAAKEIRRRGGVPRG